MTFAGEDHVFPRLLLFTVIAQSQNYAYSKTTEHTKKNATGFGLFFFCLRQIVNCLVSHRNILCSLVNTQNIPQNRPKLCKSNQLNHKHFILCVFFSSICDHISGGGAFTHTTRNILERITKPPHTHTATTTKTRTYARCPSKNACATQTKGQTRGAAHPTPTHIHAHAKLICNSMRSSICYAYTHTHTRR